MKVLIVGSTALDSIKTPKAENPRLLGGSASHAAVAASFFGPVQLVGVVGQDFPGRYLRLYQRHGIDLAGLQRRPGRTFHWSGEYAANMNQRRTLRTELGVFEQFTPELPPAYRDTPFVLLANIAPGLQHHVLNQMRRPRFVAADTMDLWLKVARSELLRLLRRLDLFVLNDSEAQQLTGEENPLAALPLIHRRGPKYVVIKQGSHGSILSGPHGGSSARLSAAPGGGSDRRRGFVHRWADGLPGRGAGAGRAPSAAGDGLRERGGVVLLRRVRRAAHDPGHPGAD